MYRTRLMTGLIMCDIAKYLGLIFCCYVTIIPRQVNVTEHCIGYALLGLFVAGICVSFKDHHIWYKTHYKETYEDNEEF